MDEKVVNENLYFRKKLKFVTLEDMQIFANVVLPDTNVSILKTSSVRKNVYCLDEMW